MSSAPGRILIVEDDAALRDLLEEELRESGLEVETASGGHEALSILTARRCDVVVSDLVMPGMRGDELLAAIRDVDPEIPVVLVTAFGTIDSAVAAVKSGAYHYVAKPFSTEVLRSTIESALRERRLRDEIRGLKDALGAEGGPTIVGLCPAFLQAMDLVRRAAPVDAPVLLLGESGTGKELVARALHAGGPRRDRPFLALNCSAVPVPLLESQLFGHRRGAFTDAREDRRGLFQEAEGGPLLLDEIGDMPPLLQAKLLRVLQEKEVQPLGAPVPVPINVRVVAATHRDLKSLIGTGRFRQDLYFRLDVIEIRLPPLRERGDDMVPLVAHLLEKHRRRLGRGPCNIAPEALEALRAYDWPGNVRELENALERALILGRDDVVWLHDFPEAIRSGFARREKHIHHAGTPITDAPAPKPAGERPLREVEREHVLKTLEAVHGNKTAAARILGLDRKTLYRKLVQYRVRVD
jgi:two-component system response regulator AtoC